MTRRGFTILEILAVLTVIGILSAIGINNFLAYQRTLVLRQAATQVATDLSRIRTEARRTSQTWVFRVNADQKSYDTGPQDPTVGTKGGAPAGTIIAGRQRTASLPTSIQLNSAYLVRYSAPYGVNANGASQSVVLSRTDTPSKTINVNVVGVTGKVVVQ